jgi:hypothetical protein
MNPLQGLFLKLDDLINLSDLDKLFFKNVMSIDLLMQLITNKMKEVKKKEWLLLYHPLEVCLTVKELDPSMFMDKRWEDIFFDSLPETN